MLFRNHPPLGSHPLFFMVKVIWSVSRSKAQKPSFCGLLFVSIAMPERPKVPCESKRRWLVPRAHLPRRCRTTCQQVPFLIWSNIWTPGEFRGHRQRAKLKRSFSFAVPRLWSRRFKLLWRCWRKYTKIKTRSNFWLQLQFGHRSWKCLQLNQRK